MRGTRWKAREREECPGGKRSRKVENQDAGIVMKLYVAELLCRGIVMSRNCYGPVHDSLDRDKAAVDNNTGGNTAVFF